MSRSDLDQLMSNFDVDVDALAVCEVRHGRALLGSPEDAIIVHYVLAGTMILSVEGKPARACPPGSIVVVPPGLAQTISTDAATTQTVAAADHVVLLRDGLLKIDAADGSPGDLRFVCGSVSAHMACFSALVGQVAGLVVEDMGDRPFVRHAFDLMLEEVEAEATGGRALAGALMKSCLVLMMRRRLETMAADPVGLGGRLLPGMRRALNVILDLPGAQHDVGRLAAAAGMSRSSFAKAFAQAFNVTPMAFVARARLQHAAGLLRSTQGPVKSIAAAAGFSSRSHFSRVFREAYGLDPSQFRKVPAPD